MTDKVKSFFSGITQKQCAEFGQVATLICLFLALFLSNTHYVKAAFAFILVTLTFPFLLYPAALIWFRLSSVLAVISSKVLISIVFVFVVIPVGLIRRMMGKDSLKLRQFKKGKQSVMFKRDHVYTGADLLNTF